MFLEEISKITALGKIPTLQLREASILM